MNFGDWAKGTFKIWLKLTFWAIFLILFGWAVFS